MPRHPCLTVAGFRLRLRIQKLRTSLSCVELHAVEGKYTSNCRTLRAELILLKKRILYTDITAYKKRVQRNNNDPLAPHCLTSILTFRKDLRELHKEIKVFIRVERSTYQ